MDNVWFVVEECYKGEDLGEGCGNDFLEFFTGDAIGLVCQVEEDSSSCGEGVGALRVIDKLFDGELHCFDHKV